MIHDLSSYVTAKEKRAAKASLVRAARGDAYYCLQSHEADQTQLLWDSIQTVDSPGRIRTAVRGSKGLYDWPLHHGTAAGTNSVAYKCFTFA